MTRAQIEIDIPDDYEIVEIEQQGDTISSGDGNGVIGHVFFTAITRKAWQWPAWLKCDWVARNENGRIAIGNGKAHALQKVWGPSADGGVDYVEADYLEINLPPCTDWRQSLRLNPNREAKP